MANTIRIKKRASGGASGAPSSLAPSELAYSEVDNILHYGYGDAGGGAASSVIAIAGSGAYATLTGNQTISGNDAGDEKRADRGFRQDTVAHHDDAGRD